MGSSTITPFHVPKGVQKFSTTAGSCFVKISPAPVPESISTNGMPAGATLTGVFEEVEDDLYYVYQKQVNGSLHYGIQQGVSNNWVLGDGKTAILCAIHRSEYIFFLDANSNVWCLNHKNKDLMPTQLSIHSPITADWMDVSPDCIYLVGASDQIQILKIPFAPHPDDWPTLAASSLIDVAIQPETQDSFVRILAGDDATVFLVAGGNSLPLTLWSADTSNVSGGSSITPTKVSDLPAGAQGCSSICFQRIMMNHSTGTGLGTPVIYWYMIDENGRGYLGQDACGTLSTGLYWFHTFTGHLGSPNLRVSHAGMLRYFEAEKNQEGSSSTPASLKKINPCEKFYLDSKGPARIGTTMLPNRMFELSQKPEGGPLTGTSLEICQDAAFTKHICSIFLNHNLEPNGILDASVWYQVVGNQNPQKAVIQITNMDATALLINLVLDIDGNVIIGEVDIDPLAPH